MCEYARGDDYCVSRFRWYDVPALVLLHRPIRCKMCGRRSYGIGVGKFRFPVIPYLWMHCIASIAIIGALTFLVTHHGDSPVLSRWFAGH
ncbi:hypothetical protein [Planctomicrobium sp. SH664]|uniref:hypothetical protein n=1 Tax=Planctomicrobium sp. SH664 TaxID=3448125 RepID=UPI003F5CB6BD